MDRPCERPNLRLTTCVWHWVDPHTTLFDPFFALCTFRSAMKDLEVGKAREETNKGKERAEKEKGRAEEEETLAFSFSALAISCSALAFSLAVFALAFPNSRSFRADLKVAGSDHTRHPMALAKPPRIQWPGMPLGGPSLRTQSEEGWAGCVNDPFSGSRCVALGGPSHNLVRPLLRTAYIQVHIQVRHERSGAGEGKGGDGQRKGKGEKEKGRAQKEKTLAISFSGFAFSLAVFAFSCPNSRSFRADLKVADSGHTRHPMALATPPRIQWPGMPLGGPSLRRQSEEG